MSTSSLEVRIDDSSTACQGSDELQIGTYTGHYEPVKEMADLLDEYEARTGHSVPIHVDGASGAFIAPFATPKLEWDFKIPRVVSINASGHKFGLSYVGVGWVVWRSKKFLPKDLIFELHYLGSVEYSFSLNFSRPAHPIIAQYFNFVHLGFEGYRNVALQDLKNARLLSRALEKSGLFVVLSDIHRPVNGIVSAAQATVGFDEEKVEVSSVHSPLSVRTEFIDASNPELRSRPSRRVVQVLRRLQAEEPGRPAEVGPSPPPGEGLDRPELRARAGPAERGDPPRGGS